MIFVIIWQFESLNKAPSSFIQFKAIEILMHLYNIDNDAFSMIELDFGQYAKKLYENSLTKDSSEKFHNLLLFTKEKHQEDFNILNDEHIIELGDPEQIINTQDE